MNKKQYEQEYIRSLANIENYWGGEAKTRLTWQRPWKRVLSRKKGHSFWFEGGRLNITETCLGKNVRNKQGKKLAYIEINEFNQERRLTYTQLLQEVNKCANAFKKLGVRRGSVVAIYLPASLEQIIAMLAAARIGAVHSVVFAGLSAEALHERMVDAKASLLVTADGFERRGTVINMLAVARQAARNTRSIKHVLVLRRISDTVPLHPRELDWKELVSVQSERCAPVYTESDDPLFVLYTSGSTGKPKGIVHGASGYGLFAAFTTARSFDLKTNDVVWCTADAGWITGHSYVVYGPLMNGCTSLVVAGPPDYPTPDRWWNILEHYGVSIFYTSPTAIRLMRLHGTKALAQRTFKKLRVIGSVGEPLNPDVARWYKKYVGKGRAHLIDTWWQTETGGHMITTLPGLVSKDGKAGLPMFGIEADVVNELGERVSVGSQGILVIRNRWPGALVACLNDEKKFQTYWNRQDFFTTGDIAIRDKDGYFQILGRYDDVINVSGHRIGSAELEHAALQEHAVGEAAAIGIPHPIKGEAIKLFCVIRPGHNKNQTLKAAISSQIAKAIGSFAKPEEIVFVAKLPKTRSGKIMRRLLRKQEKHEPLGDLSTLED